MQTYLIGEPIHMAEPRDSYKFQKQIKTGGNWQESHENASMS